MVDGQPEPSDGTVPHGFRWSFPHVGGRGARAGEESSNASPKVLGHQLLMQLPDLTQEVASWFVCAGVLVSGRRQPTHDPGRRSATRSERRRAAVERRRQLVRKHARGERRVRRRRLIVRASASGLVLVVVAVVVTVLVVRSGGPTHVTLTGTIVDNKPTGTFSISSSPAAYTAQYRLDSYDEKGKATTTTQDYTIRRPFDAKIVAKIGAPPGGTENFSIIGTLGLYSQTSAGSAANVTHGAPQTALGDYRFDGALTDLVAQGLFVARERREVLGRECQVYRTGQSLETFSVAGPAEDSYSDVCIDSSGLVLEEVSVLANKVSERRIATKVDVAAKPADSVFAITGTPSTIAAGGQEFNSISSTTVPTTGYWLLDEPPAGYTLQGRYVLRVPAASSDTAATTTTTAGQEPPVTESYVDVYVDGENAILIEQGPTAAEPSTVATSGAEVDAGALGTAHMAAGIVGSALAATPAATVPWFVHVTGSVPLAEIKKVASALHV